VDLGFAMARRWWRPLWGAWAALVVPAQLGLFLLLRQAPGLALLLCWWLLPLWERVPLFVVSRALFGVVPTVRQAAAGLWSVGWAGLVADLSWRRLSPIRTVVLSVSLLERLAGSRAAHRRRVLSQQVRVVGMGLAFASLLFEAGVIAGLLVLAGWCLPEGPRWSSEVLWDELLAGRGWAVATLATFTVAVLGLVQPLRTCAAFSLYLQRRTVLEGWDVELSFRRLAARIASRAGGVRASRHSGRALARAAVSSASPPIASHCSGNRCSGSRQPNACTLTTATSTQASATPTGTASAAISAASASILSSSSRASRARVTPIAHKGANCGSRIDDSVVRLASSAAPATASVSAFSAAVTAKVLSNRPSDSRLTPA